MVVWCEDRQHEQFAREFLTRRLGIARRDIEFQTAPKGQGAAAQWVVKQYPQVVLRARAARNQARRGFLVIVDGNSVGLTARLRSLCGEPDLRGQSDRIAIWVPTWSVETWVLWLCRRQIEGGDVSETQSYKTDIDPDEYGALAVQAVGGWDPPRPEEAKALPALATARRETARLPAG
jgi:hypothetical protein